MPFAQGMNEALYLIFETSFKVLPGTVNASKVPIINPRFTPAVNRFTSDALTGSPDGRPVIDGKVGVDFSFELESNRESLGTLLKGLFGVPVAEYGLASGLFDHYFVLAALPSMQTEMRFTDVSQNLQWGGLYIGSLDASFEAEGLMKATFGGMGAFQINEGSSTIINGAITDKTIDVPLSYLLATIKEAGVAIAYAQMVSLRVDRGLDKRNHIDATNQVGVIFGQIAKVSGTLKTSFQDKALLDKALNSTETSLEIYVPDTSNGCGLKVMTPTIKLKPAAPDTNGTGLADLSFEFDAYARGTASDTAGEVLSRFIGSGALSLNTKTLVMSIDGGGNQTITFTATETTLALTVTKINATLTGAVASSENGRLVVTSSTKGTASNVNVQASSTAIAIGDLGMSSGSKPGLTAKQIVCRLTNSTATIP